MGAVANHAPAAAFGNDLPAASAQAVVHRTSGLDVANIADPEVNKGEDAHCGGPGLFQAAHITFEEVTGLTPDVHGGI